MTSNSAGILGLLGEKNVSPEQRRKIAATGAALDLIAVAVAQNGGQHKLSEEMARLSEYVSSIEAALQSKP